MKIPKLSLPFVAAALLCFAAYTPNTKASELDQMTVVTFDEPMQIPGQVLQPGTYVFMLGEPTNTRNLVQIWNEDRSELIATTQTVPIERQTLPERSIFRVDERTSSAPAELEAWFYPGSSTGHEFVYDQSQSSEYGSSYDTSR